MIRTLEQEEAGAATPPAPRNLNMLLLSPGHAYLRLGVNVQYRPHQRPSLYRVIEPSPLLLFFATAQTSFFTSSLGFTPKTPAILRMVCGWACSKPFSSLQTVIWVNLAKRANSLWERT
jgi:hypothetical protein